MPAVRLCYSCVRDCPAKAIRISGGQAEIIAERCIGCGNCVLVCSQHAKVVRDATEKVERLLSSTATTVALMAPSFPAEFHDIDHRELVGMLRQLGFDHVVEVAFGADLVSERYRQLLLENNGRSYIGTTCPAIVQYVEKHHPSLVGNLAPIVSPMVAAARAIRRMYGADLKVVFVGPCIAKKDEVVRPDIVSDIDEVLTFRELRDMFEQHAISHDRVEASEFDPPHGGRGTLYPIGGGLLQASGLNEDFLSMDIVSSAGHKQFVQAIKEYENAEHGTVLLELNCCEGCISGSGISHAMPLFTKRGHISAFAQRRYREIDQEAYRQRLEAFSDLDLSATFRDDACPVELANLSQINSILRRMGKLAKADELNCGACGYYTCVEHATAIHQGLAEVEMCLPFTIEKLKATASELAVSYEELLKARRAMIQSEKLASLGRMASGIAHELNNPLTGVLAFSTVLKEGMEGTESEQDLDVIIQETLRCREIVKGLLEFARNSAVDKIPGDINNAVIESVSLLHMHVTFQNVRVELDLAEDIPAVEFDANQMRSVFNNLAENAAHAMPDGGTLRISTRLVGEGSRVRIDVADNGTGISEDDLHKIFDPFFTTKEPGKGTGLGLAVIYGIIEQHHGKIEVSSELGKGTVFSLTLPVQQDSNAAA